MTLMANSYLRLKRFAETIMTAYEALMYDETNTKALYVRSLAHIKENNLEAAEEDLHLASENCQDENQDAKLKIRDTLKQLNKGDVGSINPDEEKYEILLVN
jgi:tetratricopeptide (TPR) repeat protein